MFAVFFGAKSIVPRLLKDFGMGIFLMIVLITFFWCLILFSFEDDLGALFGFDAGAIQ